MEAALLSDAVEQLESEPFARFLVGEPTQSGATAAKVITDQGEKIKGHNIRYLVRMREVRADNALETLELMLKITQASNY